MFVNDEKYRGAGVHTIQRKKLPISKETNYNITAIQLNGKSLDPAVFTAISTNVSSELFHEISDLNNGTLYEYLIVSKTEKFKICMQLYCKDKLPFAVYRTLASEFKIIANDINIQSSTSISNEDPDFRDRFYRSSFGATRKALLAMKEDMNKIDKAIEKQLKNKKSIQEEYDKLYETLPDEEKLLVELEFEGDDE